MVSALKGAVVSEASSCEGNGAESEETVHWTPEGNLANANAESVEKKKNMKKNKTQKQQGNVYCAEAPLNTTAHCRPSAVITVTLFMWHFY